MLKAIYRPLFLFKCQCYKITLTESLQTCHRVSRSQTISVLRKFTEPQLVTSINKCPINTTKTIPSFFRTQCEPYLYKGSHLVLYNPWVWPLLCKLFCKLPYNEVIILNLLMFVLWTERVNQ